MIYTEAYKRKKNTVIIKIKKIVQMDLAGPGDDKITFVRARLN